MALTSAQKVNVRRYMGYSLKGNDTVAPAAEPVVSNSSYLGMTLDVRLDNLTADEESVLISTYLTNLDTLESAIVSVSANLDTDAAAVWTHNKNERCDREALFNSWCRKMCDFLGFAPGPGLNSGFNISVVRA